MRTNKAKFGVMSLPLILLAIVITLLNVAQTSYAHIVNQRILPAIEDRERIFSLKKQNSMDLEYYVPYYTEEDMTALRGIGTISDVLEVRPSLLTPATTDSLIDGESIVLQDFRGVSDKAVELIGVEDFTFTEGQPIPVVIGIEALKQYKDIVNVSNDTSAKQKEELLADYQRTSSFTSNYPHRDTVNQIKNKQFTFTLGTIDQSPILYHSIQPSDVPYSFISGESRQAIQNQTRRLIEQYWDYDNLAKGIEVKAKVVGIDYSLNKSVISLPYEAVEYLHQSLLDHQQSALLPGATIDSVGSIYHGIEVASEGIQSRYEGDGELIATETMAEILPNVYVPGLYYSINQNDAKTILNTPPSLSNIKTSEINVVMTNASQLNNTINGLVGQGLIGGFQAANIYTSYTGFSESLKSFAFYVSMILVIICVVITLFLMLRIAKNTQYETGVLRVIGATQGQALLHTTGLLSWQLFISVAVGVGLGYLTVVAAAPLVSSYLQYGSYLALDRIQDTYGIEIVIRNFDVSQIDLASLATNLGWVIGLCLIGVLLAMLLTARVMPIDIVSKNR